MRVVELRNYKDLGITQSEISARVNVAQSYISTLRKQNSSDDPEVWKKVDLIVHEDNTIELYEYRRIGNRG